jgi:hypothetical protein
VVGEKLEAARGGRVVKRGERDFGRVTRAFKESALLRGSEATRNGNADAGVE